MMKLTISLCLFKCLVLILIFILHNYYIVQYYFESTIDAILGAMAIPVIFPLQVSKNGEPFISGAVRMNLPVLEAVKTCQELGYDDIEVTGILI